MLDDQKLKDMGSQIRRLREQKGLLQADLAEALGFDTVSVISKLENGNGGRQPALWKLSEIAKQLDCTIDDLLVTKPKEQENE